jgi:anti-sigma B factor antagonist
VTALRIGERDDPDGTLWLRLAGELDLATRPQLGQRLELAAASRRRVVLDVRNLEFMDSSGLRLLLEAHDHASQDGWSFAIKPPTEGGVLRLLEITGMLDVLPLIEP